MLPFSCQQPPRRKKFDPSDEGIVDLSRSALKGGEAPLVEQIRLKSVNLGEKHGIFWKKKIKIKQYTPETKKIYQKLPCFKGSYCVQTIILGVHVSFEKCTFC